MRSMVHSIIFVSAILGIVGWSFLTPVENSENDIDPSRGYLVMESMEWSGEGTSASLKLLEVNSSSGKVLRKHELFLENGSLFKKETVEEPSLANEIKIGPDAIFSPDRSSIVVVYYEKDLSSGEDPGFHLELMEGNEEKDLTKDLRRVVNKGPALS
jgi:hypothetical protein